MWLCVQEEIHVYVPVCGGQRLALGIVLSCYGFPYYLRQSLIDQDDGQRVLPCSSRLCPAPSSGAIDMYHKAQVFFMWVMGWWGLGPHACCKYFAH